jgi:hypothetical protein
LLTSFGVHCNTGGFIKNIGAGFFEVVSRGLELRFAKEIDEKWFFLFRGEE